MNENQVLAMVSDVVESVDYDSWKDLFVNPDPDSDLAVRRLVRIATKYLEAAGVTVQRIGAA